MSWFPDKDPDCVEHNPTAAVQLVIAPRARDLGDFSVRRVLPSGKRQMVGPFIFFDHMGPVDFAPEQGMDVRPHPHIGLATVTYLFSGSMMHRDSLGCEQLITPGAVNWMVAGRGIAHSERSSPQARSVTEQLEGLQIWVALPVDKEEMPPQFIHYPAEALPQIQSEGVSIRVLAGEAYGAKSPVAIQSPLFYIDVCLRAGAAMSVDLSYTERAVYIAKGQVILEGRVYEAGHMLVLAPDRAIPLSVTKDTRLVILGGEPFSEPRYVWWNFVSSRRGRIEQAKEDWRFGRFEPVAGDREFIPLPE